MRKESNGTLFHFGLVLAAAGVALSITGCAGLPGWLTTIGQTLPLMLTTVGTVLMGISKSLGGNPALEAAAATLGAILTKTTAVLADIQAAYNEYLRDPQDSTLKRIEAGIQAGIDTINQLFDDLGLPLPIATMIRSIAQVLLNQFEAWTKILPTIQAAHSMGIKQAHALLASIPPADHPLDAHQLAERINMILSQPTGDAKLDADVVKLREALKA